MNTTGRYYHVLLAFSISLLAWPICYIFNNGFTLVDENGRTFFMMTSAFVLLGSVVLLVAKLSRETDWAYYGMTLFAFTAVIDLIITLEFNGVIKNFMNEYLSLGEPYLSCSFGSAIALFDGIGFYAMYLFMIYLITNGKSWRSVGIYWGAGIINSMIPLLLGVATGKHSPTWCTFLNVPYVVFPTVVLFRIFTTESRPVWQSSPKLSLSGKIRDWILAACFVVSIWICLAKGLGALGSQWDLVISIIKHERILFWNDPAPYSVIQALLYLFYGVPVQFICLYCLITQRLPPFLWETTLVFAGAVLQGQFSFICHAFDPNTPTQYQVSWTNWDFWMQNMVLIIVPHLFLWRLYGCMVHKTVSSRSKNKTK